MKKNRLFSLIASLPPKSRRILISQITSQNSPNIKRLLELISKKIDRHSSNTYQQLRENTLSTIFPKQHNSQKAQRLITATLKLVETFIQHQQLSKEPNSQQQLLRNYYLENRLDNIFETELINTEKQLDSKILRDDSYHQKKKQVQHDLHYSVTNNKYRKKDLTNDLISIHKHLDKAYLLEKLHYSCQLKIIKTFTNKEVEIPLLNEVLQISNTDQYQKNGLLVFYIQLWNQIDSRQPEQFDILQQTFFNIQETLTRERALHVFEMLINTGVLSVKGNNEKLFMLYKKGLENGILLFNNQISSNHFTNLVDIGIILKKSEEVRSLIKQHLKHLNVKEENRHNIETLFEAFLENANKNYSKVLQQLSYLEFEDYSFGFRAYKLLIISLYETRKSNGYEVLEARCEAFKQYVQRKYKEGYINIEQKEERLNFIKIVKLLPAAGRYSKNNPEVLLKKLEAMPRVLNRTWLLEKINEL